ncbi:MAG: substrate-binding domain-containing protein, partial [Deltaproteobacteria bacterium]|nr:substrate-binding domain-containing protein [Deltaproteobacteria bacterium]
LVPLDVKVAEPVLKRAQEAGIPVITHEGPEQEGRTWNVELIDSVVFGEVQMQKLAEEMGEEGEYVVYVGTLTTPLHNIWADSAIAYQEKNYPNMKLVTDRFPGADARVAIATTDLARICANLVLNARDAIAGAGTIAVRVTRELAHVVIEVEDNGAGMDAATLARLFQPFFTTKPVGRGTGLGLATSKILVERAAGLITVVSEVGHGTCFTIRLPLVASAHPEAACSPAR